MATNDALRFLFVADMIVTAVNNSLGKIRMSK